MGGTRGTGVQRFGLFMWIATALWLIAALAAVIDGDTLNAVAWVAAGALSASGITERSRGLAYLAVVLLIASVGILMGVFLAD
jgi:thiol:disulfide interchange protein